MKNRQKIRNFTPFLGLLSIIIITSLKIDPFGFSKYGLEPRDIFVIILIPAMIYLGNIYCGWFCFGGMMQKVIYKIGTKIFGKEKQKKLEVPEHIHNKLKYMRYIILIMWVISIILSAFGIIDPSVSKYIKVTLMGILSVITLPFALFTERILCRYFCINGAIYGLFNKIGIKRIIRNNSCVSCKKCDKVCPVNVEVSTQRKVTDLHCINCYKCVDDCPVPTALNIEIPVKIIS
ncbi:4Fe-4S dicluster domain-containing protein [Clostridiaceae bacterium HSG29]|nr:4Fe-4S dicluster domain-containing protein [Clostridiaceae bacterium HSG29]